ncbi:MAG: DUF4325 domain-containing protein [Candidatus Thiodiazotropha endolucinida]
MDEMRDWKGSLGSIKRKMQKDRAVTITLPPRFSFKNHGLINFESVLDFFDWSLKGRQVKIDFTKCKSPNYQALTLLVLYAWKLKQQKCRVSFELDTSISGASQIWKTMGAQGLFQVATHEDQNFRGNRFKPLIAIRNPGDFKEALKTVESYTSGFNVEYMNTLRYVLSELLYNTQEHGASQFHWKGKQKRVPSLIQFAWYQNHNEIHFIVCDTGIGIKSHLEQAYPGFESHEEAIRKAIRPQVSGTFGHSDPYSAKNNAGVGLYISSNIIRRLSADMHIVSGNGEVHISPRDITSRTLDNSWPGTFVLVSVRIAEEAKFALHSMMQEFRESARKEVAKNDAEQKDEEFYCSINNYFGPFAEDKTAAISLRDRRIIPAIQEGKKVVVDFDEIKSCPHSFLSALLATPIKILGMSAYKKIRILNASPEIRETIDYILDENTE